MNPFREFAIWRAAPQFELYRDELVAAWREFHATDFGNGIHQVEALIPPPFDPHNGLFGYYPGLAASGMPILNVGSTGPYVAYMQGVLYWKANQPCRPQPISQSQSWGYGPVTRNCVIAFKRFFGIIPSWSTNSTVDAATWSAIQYCANYL